MKIEHNYKLSSDLAIASLKQLSKTTKKCAESVERYLKQQKNFCCMLFLDILLQFELLK